MKKKLLFSFLIIFIGLFYVNVNALSAPVPSFSTIGDLAMDTEIDDSNAAIDIRTGESVQLYFYYYVIHDMQEDPDIGKSTIYSKPDLSKLQWSSSNSKILAVDSTGKIKALRTGTANITVCYDDGIQGSSIDCRGIQQVSIVKNSSCAAETPYKYNIKLDSTGGTNYDKIVICPTCSGTTSNMDVTLPTPEKKGYTFDGWFTDTNYRTRISKLSQDYTKVIVDEDYENYCPQYSYTGTIYAKWTQTVEVPNTGIDGSKIALIVGLFLTMIGSLVICYNIRANENV